MGKDNVVANASTRKSVSMGSIAYYSVTKQPLAKEIQTLKAKFIVVGHLRKRGVLILNLMSHTLRKSKPNNLIIRVWKNSKRSWRMVRHKRPFFMRRVFLKWNKGFMFLDLKDWFKNYWQSLTVHDILWPRCIYIWNKFIGG